VKEYDGKVRVVYLNFVVHPRQVQMAHQYGCAASKQGKFLEYKRAFWEKSFGAYASSQGKDQSALGPEGILKWAPDVGIDPQRLKTDGESAECQNRIEADKKELERFSVNGTPGFFINGKFIGGGIPKEQFKAIIDEKLKVAEKSGVPAAEYYAKEIYGKGEHQRAPTNE
jgi:protein-disulfide isomerase